MNSAVRLIVAAPLLLVATAASAEFPSSFPAGDYIYGGISEDGTIKVFIDRDPYRNDDSVGGAFTLLFSSEQTLPSGRHYWAKRTGFSGHCEANTIYMGDVSGYEDGNGIIQFSNDPPNPAPPFEEKSAAPDSLGAIVLAAACRR